MTNGLILSALAGLAVSATLALRPDPWAVASDYARQNTAEILVLGTQYDLINVRVAEHGALHQVALWDDAGTLIYPLPDGFSPLKNELSQGDLADVSAVLATVDGAEWIPFDLDGQQVLYCQSIPAACLVYDRAALANALGVSSLGAASAFQMRAVATILAMISIGLIGMTVWRRRTRASDNMGLELLADEFCARRDGLNIQLSKRDTKILALLLARAGKVVTRDELYDEGWGRDYMPNSRALDQHIINLRRKLNPDNNRPELIETVRGIGYRIVGQ